MFLYTSDLEIFLGCTKTIKIYWCWYWHWFEGTEIN